MNKDLLIEVFSSKVRENKGALFVGSGISVDSGLPDWLNLIKRYAKEIGLSIRPTDDYPLIAQYIVNENAGNKNLLVGSFRDKMARPLIPNEYHDLIALVGVSSIWTTNYDTLLEDSLPGYHVRAANADMEHPGNPSQQEIIKLHGCIRRSKPEDIVITKDDYEDYFSKHPAMSRRLEIEMVKNSFLFIGYGYGDPNISNILIESRRLAPQSSRHFMIQKAVDPADAKKADEALRQKLYVKELSRIGITCVLIPEYDDLKSILSEIAQKSRGKTVFFTGSHKGTNSYSKEIGKQLAGISDVVLLDGQSTGVSREIISAFSEAILIQKKDIREKLRLFANPYAIKPAFENDPDLIRELQSWREPLFKAARIMVVFDGSIGTRSEIAVARSNRCIIVPFPLKAGDLPHQLLREPKIAKFLTDCVPDYFEAADRCAPTPELLIKSLKTLFSS